MAKPLSNGPVAGQDRAGWLQGPLAAHMAAIVLLTLWIALRWRVHVMAPFALHDERIYLEAFRAVAEGGSAYTVDGYYYPAAFAVLGSWLLRGLGEAGTGALLRLSSVVGLAVAVWLSLALWATTWGRRLAVAAVFVAVAPAARYGLETGNLSFSVIAVILLSLTLWPHRAMASGLMLGGSVAVKPLAPLATLALMAHRPVGGGRRQLIAGAVAVLCSLVALLPWPAFLEMSTQTIDRLPFIRSISLQRVLTLIGVRLSPLVVTAACALVVLLAVRWRPLSKPELIGVAGTAAVMAVPIIWSHTLLLTLPVQVIALQRAVARRRDLQQRPVETRSDVETSWRRYEIVLVGLAALALQLTEGAGAIDDQAVAFQLPVLAGAYLAAPALAAYILATRAR